jgi:hypothetical protein
MEGCHTSLTFVYIFLLLVNATNERGILTQILFQKLQSVPVRILVASWLLSGENYAQIQIGKVPQLYMTAV